MSRLETIDFMISKAKAITGRNSINWTRDKEKEIWNLVYDWNSENDSEIFMCEVNKNAGYDFNGFMIEDDYFVVEH